ncbi:MAG: glycosyltransferase family 2 protein [Deltaproteobacteria bacterium]
MTTIGLHCEGDLELSLVVPAFNEAGDIAGVLGSAAAYLEGAGIDYEINVVDDGSRDGTAGVLGRVSEKNPRVRVVTHQRNRGYGAALRSGIAVARGKRILVSDGDGQFDISNMAALWARRDEADMIIGYRRRRRDPILRRVAGWLYSRVVIPCLLGGRYRDVNCGFKLISRRVLAGMELTSNGALISAELLTRARMEGASVVEVGVDHRPRRHGRGSGLLPRVVFTMLRELAVFRLRAVAQVAANRQASLPHGSDTVKSRAS